MKLFVSSLSGLPHSSYKNATSVTIKHCMRQTVVMPRLHSLFLILDIAKAKEPLQENQTKLFKLLRFEIANGCCPLKWCFCCQLERLRDEERETRKWLFFMFFWRQHGSCSCHEYEKSHHGSYVNLLPFHCINSTLLMKLLQPLV